MYQNKGSTINVKIFVDKCFQILNEILKKKITNKLIPTLDQMKGVCIY